MGWGDWWIRTQTSTQVSFSRSKCMGGFPRHGSLAVWVETLQRDGEGKFKAHELSSCLNRFFLGFGHCSRLVLCTGFIFLQQVLKMYPEPDTLVSFGKVMLSYVEPFLTFLVVKAEEPNIYWKPAPYEKWLKWETTQWRIVNTMANWMSSQWPVAKRT